MPVWPSMASRSRSAWPLCRRTHRPCAGSTSAAISHPNAGSRTRGLAAARPRRRPRPPTRLAGTPQQPGPTRLGHRQTRVRRVEPAIDRRHVVTGKAAAEPSSFDHDGSDGAAERRTSRPWPPAGRTRRRSGRLLGLSHRSAVAHDRPDTASSAARLAMKDPWCLETAESRRFGSGSAHRSQASRHEFGVAKPASRA